MVVVVVNVADEEIARGDAGYLVVGGVETENTEVGRDVARR